MLVLTAGRCLSLCHQNMIRIVGVDGIDLWITDLLLTREATPQATVVDAALAAWKDANRLLFRTKFKEYR